MPRSARLDCPRALHHIIVRGIDRTKIFRDDADREDFLERLEKLLPATGTMCCAWALIPNHAHFLFRTGKEPIATLMRRLLTGYAVYFNRRHKRKGQLFQNRYKSILCQEDVYLTELVRYIHLNPLRSGLAKSYETLVDYPYGGHGAVMGRVKRDWQDVDHVLSHFGKRRQIARKNYSNYVSAGILRGRRDDLTGGGLIRSLGGWSAVNRKDLKSKHIKSDERILGDEDFVDSLLSEAGEKLDRRYEVKRSGYDLETTARRAAEVCGTSTDDIFSRSKQNAKVKARSVFCYWAVRELKISLTELAKRLNISVPAVSYSVGRGKRTVQECGYQLIP